MANLLSTNVSGNLYVSGYTDTAVNSGAFRFYDGSTFRGGLGLEDWAFGGSAANIVMYVNGDNNFFISTSGIKRAQFNSTAAIFRTYTADNGYNIRITGGDQFNAYYNDSATAMYINWNGGTTRFGTGGIRSAGDITADTNIWAANGNGRIALGGNLHIDSYNGNDIYLNYYTNQPIRTYGATHVNGIAYLNGYTKVSYDWAGGNYGAEQLTIRGTYPSIALRSTTHDSKWLIHNDNNISFYYGTTVDDNSWSRRFFIPTDGNIWMSWADANISTLLDAKQNASTAITTSNIGSQSVSYASSAGNSATTSQIVFSDLKTNFPSGYGGGHSFGANHYSMGLDSGDGGWNGPHYRDLIIGYHTGVRIGASYSGIRFYNNSPTTDANNDGNGDVGETLLMTIGGYVGTANQTDVVVNNNLFANVSMRSPIFYDSNDTYYYVDPNSTSRLVSTRILGEIRFQNGSYYNNLEYWGARMYSQDDGNGVPLYVQVQWVDGWYNALKIASGLDDNNPSLRTYRTTQLATDAGNVSIGGTASSHKLHVYGTAFATSDFRAPIFYDSDNTTYYVDPNGMSSVYGVAIRGDQSSTDTSNQIFFWDGGNTTTSAIGFKSNGGYFTNPTGSGDGYNTYFTMDTPGRGWVFRRGNGGSDFGAAYTSGWILNNGVWQANDSMRAPIFYDSADTAFYLDPASTGISLNVAGSVRGTYYVASNYSATGYTQYKGYDNNNHFIVIRGSVSGTTASPTITGAHQTTFVEYAESNDSTGWFFKTAGTGNYDIVGRITRSYSQFEGSLRAPIFYDSDDTSYYVNPNGTSRLNDVNAPQGYVSIGNPWGTANSAYFPNGITTAGNDNWIYGHTYIGNAPSNGNGHEFFMNGNSHSSGTVTIGGSVGIGTNSPNKQLTFASVNDDAIQIRRLTTSEGNTDVGTGISWTWTSSGTDNETWAALRVIMPGSGNSHMTFSTKASGGSVSEKMRITDAGNVGIGTTNPSEKLHVEGGLRVSGNIINSGATYLGIIYDYDDNGYYLNPSATSRLYHLEVWNNFDTATNDVYANMRVIRNNSYTDGMYIGYNNAGNGITRLFGGTDNAPLEKHPSYTYEPGSFRAPIFYDSADTGYYGDFAGYSRMSEIGVTNHYTYNYHEVISSRANSTFGHVALFRSTQSATSNYIPFSFESSHGDHSWGQVARFHIGTSNGADRPSIQFSTGHSNTRWNIGYCSADDNFRIVQDMGYRPDMSGNYDNWGTERFKIDTAGNVWAPASLRTSILYDAADATYYLDPNSKSRLYTVYPRNLGGATLNHRMTDMGVNGSGSYEEIEFIDGSVVHAHVSTGTGANNGCYNWFGTEYVDVDPEKDYEFSVWVRSTGDDHVYMGWHEQDSNGATITSNPYFHSDKTNTGGTWVKLTARLKNWRTLSNQGPTEFDRWATAQSFLNNVPGAAACQDGVMHENTRFIHMRCGTCYGSVSGSKTYFYAPRIREITYDEVQNHFVVPYYNGSSWGGKLRFGYNDWGYYGIGMYGAAGEFRMSSDIGDLNLRVDGFIQAHSDMRAPIFYDSDDTNYYCDPNSQSKFRKLWIDNGGASGVAWSSGLNMGDGTNYWNLIQDAGIARQRNFGTGGYDWYNNTASTQLMILSNAGNLTVSGDVTAYSDARIKTNVQTIENALDKTLKLRGVTYNRTDSEDTSTKVGVIAQEILEVIPEVVKQNDEGMYSVSYGNLTAVLIEAIKEQQKQIDELKEIINGLTK